MRLIDADVLLKMLDTSPTLPSFLDVIIIIGKTPTFEVVRCGECKWWVKELDGTYCERHGEYSGFYMPFEANDFCSYGERLNDVSL